MPKGKLYNSILSNLKIVLPSFVIFHNCGNQFHILWNKIMTTTQMKLNFPTSYRNSIIFFFTCLHNLTKYPFLKWQWIFNFLRRFFFSFLYHYQDFYRTWLYTWSTRRVPYRKRELLTHLEHLVSSWFFVGSMLLFSFLSWGFFLVFFRGGGVLVQSTSFCRCFCIFL